MYTAIVILMIIVCVFLVLAVLVQNSKGGGLASGFASSGQVMGVRKTADFLEKLTWGLAAGLISLSLLANFALPKKGEKERSSDLKEKIENSATPVEGIPSNIPNPANKPQGK